LGKIGKFPPDTSPNSHKARGESVRIRASFEWGGKKKKRGTRDIPTRMAPPQSPWSMIGNRGTATLQRGGSGPGIVRVAVKRIRIPGPNLSRIGTNAMASQHPWQTPAGKKEWVGCWGFGGASQCSGAMDKQSNIAREERKGRAKKKTIYGTRKTMSRRGKRVARKFSGKKIR